MKLFLQIILFFISVSIQAQSNSILATEISTKKTDIDLFLGIDEYGYEYSSKNNILFKSDSTVKLEYQNISLGKISRVDLQNPLRVLVFYENFNTIVSLDKQLNEISKINITEINPEISTNAIGLAAQNNYWIFNQLNQQLYLYNFNKNSFQTTGVYFDKGIKIYTTSYNTFTWLDTENNIYKCDFFGKKTFMGKLTDYDNISFADENYLVVSKEDKLFLYSIEKNTLAEIKNVQKSTKSFCYKNQILSIFTTEGITHYKINVP